MIAPLIGWPAALFINSLSHANWSLLQPRSVLYGALFNFSVVYVHRRFDVVVVLRRLTRCCLNFKRRRRFTRIDIISRDTRFTVQSLMHRSWRHIIQSHARQFRFRSI